MEVSKCWKIVEFSKISVKMKNCKTFYKTQTASRLQEIIQSSPNPSPSDKMLLCLWKKKFLTEICRNIQTFAFKLLQKCSSWVSRDRAVQMFSLIPSRDMSAGKFLKSERFSAVLREYIIFNVKWVEVRKINGVFRAKLYCKMSDLFCWFLLALRLSARKS